MKLTYIKNMKIAFQPFWGTPAIREFISRTSTKKAVASNPKCHISVEVIEPKGTEWLWAPVPSTIDIDYDDGSKQRITPIQGMHVQGIIEQITQKQEAIEYANDITEMKANPSGGPRPIRVFKTRLGYPFAVYAEDAEKGGKRAKGGVKTK
mmetsp:Transcript_14205/g.28076  ORF Transcript_14205/g.28076 Transcript_14205/m.28076 type:complete len:151 (+) Transcript_14205:106-558(+)|eukprot:CAMPEP_0173391038 /NCGR_PEP_ID=MMETSP1356-20130122/17071_1 /TAXON_ID=77927 ORGANISM="Hemiselmis virescens, Strain PCC157" /NCGR_SAMPLE_ID=MMETSP1356 /ASSEMBLY_ACC=CAM_ASM_000847 /LENGTH=150 /DNA_ID=CAMNT_0014348565 /DNA_START=102 /DNA_END=554 /DNA_ORIENTATION=+